MTFTFQSARLTFDQESLELIPNKTNSSEALYVDFNSTITASQQRFQIFIHPKKEVTLKEFELRFSVPLSPNSQVLCNGFQPGHRSGFFQLSDKLPGRGWLISKESFHKKAPTFPNASPFQSWHYGYVSTQEKGLFIGSLNETTAFTAIEYDQQKQQILIRKDIADLQLGHSFPLLDLIILPGKKETTFAAYFSAMENSQLPAPPLTGWMASKANNGNSAVAINDFLTNKVAENIPADLVLIGPGYAKEAGDWLFSGDQFPEGLPPLIAKIKATGLKVGMNIAPLLCSNNSDVYRQHPDWLLQDKQNNPIKINTESGTRYVLDAYHPGVQDSLQVFCYTVTTQWGVDLLKFDSLSTAFATARKTKTRAQTSNDFLKMLRDSSPNCLIWATDLPLATSWLYANYTSTTRNNFATWKTNFPLLYANPNADTAKVQLKNIIHRFCYGQYGTAANMITLNTAKELTAEQQHTILMINALFSNISVIGDAPKNLSAEMWSEWRLSEQWKSAKVKAVGFPNEDTCIIDFENNRQKFRGLVNFSNKKNTIEGIELLAGETLVLKRR